MADPKESPRSRPLGAARPDPTGPPARPEEARRPGSGLHQPSGSGLLPSVEAEGAERWVSGKSEDELLADLRAYLARLRDDPHNIPDRLRVAAIQLRLGRVDEALIHYEGVVRGYVAHGQILSAIALCEQILGLYPNLQHLQKLLAALYARAPRGSIKAEAAVTPITKEEAFVVSEPGRPMVDPEDAATDRNVVVDRLWSAPQRNAGERSHISLLDDDELRPTMPFNPVPRAKDDADDPIPLTHKKRPQYTQEDASGEEVVLLTHPKRKTDR